MRRVKRVIVLILIVMLCMPLLPGVQTEAADGGKHLDVLFTHDTHSHLNSYSTIVNGKQKEVGGFARIKTLIDEKKKENPDTLILDGGDFSMGTLIQTVYTTEAAELRMLGYLGCDVTTFGNHEFDYRSGGLADMLKIAKNSGETVPELVVCNVDWDAMEKEGLSKGQKQIESAFETYGVKDYVVIQKGGVKIAVLGVFGKDALECAPTCELEFKDPVESAKNTVEEIKKKEAEMYTEDDEDEEEYTGDEEVVGSVNSVKGNVVKEIGGSKVYGVSSLSLIREYGLIVSKKLNLCGISSTLITKTNIQRLKDYLDEHRVEGSGISVLIVSQNASRELSYKVQGVDIEELEQVLGKVG